MKPKHYYCEVYRHNYYLYIGWTPVNFAGYIKKFYGFSPTMDGVEGKVLTTAGPIVHVYTKKGAKLSIVAHECVHAAAMTLDKVGIDIRNDDGEALAYLTESIFRKATGK